MKEQLLISALFDQRQDSRKQHEAVSVKFRLDMKKKFFPQWVVSHWTRSPREVVTATRLMEYQEHLNNSLRHRVRFLGCSVQGQGLDSMILERPFQLSICWDSMVLCTACTQGGVLHTSAQPWPALATHRNSLPSS